MARFPFHCIMACLLATSAVSAQNAAQNALQTAAPPSAAVSRDGGWDGLARLLEALKPGVDTAIAPTASQITDRIAALLDRGQAAAALALILERLAAEEDRGTNPRRPGTDVQLAFLHARALAATGRIAAAERQYEALTRAYPELPEPWNNLAALYVQQGQLERARLALQTALSIAPQYGPAQANLADVHLMMALAAYTAAAELNVAGARGRAQSLRNLLEEP